MARHPVTNPRTFESTALRAHPVEHVIGDVVVSLAGIDDLAVLKLISMRDQDLVDLMLLSSVGISAAAIARTATCDDIERTLSFGAIQARHALRTGMAREVFEQTMGRPPDDNEVHRLSEVLAALERSGL
jgi:hypothetical protein